MSHGLKTKVSYATREDAVAAALRRRQHGMDLVPYLCTRVKPESIHPLQRVPHWHLKTRSTYRSDGVRFHEEWNPVLGARVVGCMLAENNPRYSEEKRRHIVEWRVRRRG